MNATEVEIPGSEHEEEHISQERRTSPVDILYMKSFFFIYKSSEIKICNPKTLIDKV